MLKSGLLVCNLTSVKSTLLSPAAQLPECRPAVRDQHGKHEVVMFCHSQNLVPLESRPSLRQPWQPPDFCPGDDSACSRTSLEVEPPARNLLSTRVFGDQPVLQPISILLVLEISRLRRHQLRWSIHLLKDV